MSVRNSTPRVAQYLAAAAVTGGLLLAGAVPAVAATGAARTGAASPAAHADRQVATVTVTGEGSASAAPDMAVLTAGVEVTRPTAKEAMAAQSSAAEALLAAIRAQGVADRDVRTDSLSLNAAYQHEDNTSKLVGYQASQIFSIKVRDIGKTGAVIQAATDAAGDAGRVHSVSFDVSDSKALRTKARKAANEDARDKAEQLARNTGHKLGRLVSISEADGGAPSPVAMPAVAFDKEGVPVAPGEVEDRVTVTAVYELV
ncbi:SIMPL domain-containing protein [Streptomyces sp. NPDC050504]|uniref:SIMPL domain-containing protein n=1 Tax=Streptomyces sp. NPDC050504 TaxID=3365618 RepID=UPI0037A19601